VAEGARAARDRTQKRGLGLGPAIRRLREQRRIGQEVLAERIEISQSYLSQIESGRDVTVTEERLGRIAAALGVESWVILAMAAGLRLEDVERLSEEERIWLDIFRALDTEQREIIRRVAMAMRKPPRGRKRSD
jgi:transcriptional regulator with XRE-family HTH domain